MIKVLKTLILSLLASPMLFAQHSLDELINTARIHHPQQAQMALIKESTELKLKEISGAYLPQSTLGGQATWQSEVTSISIPLPGIDIQPPPQDQYKLTLDLQQNIWDGGLTAARKAQAKTDQVVQENSIATELIKVEEQVSQLFFGAIIADKQRTNANLLLDDLQARMKVVKAAVENGVATRPSLLDLRAKELELRQKMAEIDQMKKSVMESLSLLTGKTLDSNTPLSEDVFTSGSEGENNRPELAFLSAKQSSLLVGEQLIKAKNAPKLALFATGGYGRPGLNFLARDFSPYFIGGVSLKIPISHLYTGGQKTEIQQLQVAQKQLDAQKEGFLLATEIQKSKQENELERLRQLISGDDELIDIREQLIRTAETQLDNGVITSADYLVELNKLDQARQNKAIHEVQLLQTRQNIRLLLGQ
ncbi:TolC family protein [Jiulongibacter sediminis]|uniref:TolC family protein n=1 Tax=Jiulongibacter sediminis TaxID=1605367 RepID=UPI0026F0F338|nr:TolC family protein [Jiulongibacter sediminis]